MIIAYHRLFGCIELFRAFVLDKRKPAKTFAGVAGGLSICIVANGQ